MNTKLLLNNNIHVLLQDFQSCVQNNYYFIPDRSLLSVSISGLYELELHKQEIVFPVIGFEDAFESVVVNEYDSTKFLLQVQKYIAAGYELDFSTLYYDSYGSKSCKMFHATHPNNIVYTKEDLENMEYDDLKRVGRLRKAFNRSRSVMQEQILRYQEEMK